MARYGYTTFEPFRPPQGLHHILSVGIPLIQSLLVQYALLAGQFLDAGWNAIFAGMGFLASLWVSWKTRRAKGFLASLWAWSAFLVVAYLLVGFHSPETWDKKFLVNGEKLFFTGLVVIHVIVSSFWQSQLVARARLLFLLEKLEGDTLMETMRQYHEDANFSIANQKALQVYLVLTNFAIVVAFAVNWSQFPHQVWALTLLLAGLVVGLLATGLFRSYRQEMERLTYGLRFSKDDKVKRFFQVFVMLILAAVAGFALASDRPFWESSRPAPSLAESAEPQIPEIVPPEERQQLDGRDLMWWLPRLFVLDVFNFKGLWLVLKAIAQVVLFLLPWVALGALLWPLIGIFRRGGWDLRLLRYYWISLCNQWAEWLAMLWDFLTRKKDRGVFRSPFEFKNTEIWLSQQLFRTGKRSKSREYPFLIGQFMKILAWGDRLGVRYHQGQTTGEFLNSIASIHPRWSADLQTSGEIINEGLFSGSALTPEEQRILESVVKTMTAWRP